MIQLFRQTLEALQGQPYPFSREYIQWLREFVRRYSDVEALAAILDSLTGLSVLGRSASTTGPAAAITAASDGDVLRRSGSTLGFGQIATAGITNAAVTMAKLADLAGLSVNGRASNSLGVPAAITAANDGEVLRRSGSSLGFGTIATAGIANNAVTLAKLATQAALSVLANATNGSAVPTAVAAANDGEVLRRSGTALGFGQLAIGAFADAIITFAKLQNFDALSVLGRSANSSGVGDEIAAGTDGHILRRSGSALGFGKILTNFITGTATNDSAAAGDIGEYQSASAASGSVGSWVSGTTQNITSMSLAAGDWDVSGVVVWSGNGLTGLGGVSAAINTVSATEPSSPDPGRITMPVFPVTTRGLQVAVGPTRIPLASTSTVYLMGSIIFTGSTTAPTAGGVIRARRPR